MTLFSDTNQTSYGASAGEKREQICVVSLDMCGETLEYGIVTPA